jgi:hypothetical protein
MLEGKGLEGIKARPTPPYRATAKYTTREVGDYHLIVVLLEDGLEDVCER